MFCLSLTEDWLSLRLTAVVLYEVDRGLALPPVDRVVLSEVDRGLPLLELDRGCVVFG